MKKIIPVLIFAMLLAVLAACTATSTTEETYNGITRTETTTTKGDEIETTVVYTDEDGNELDPEVGEAAFEAAKAEVEGTDDAAAEEEETAEAPEEAPAEASAEASDEVYYEAFVTFVNDTDTDITDIYLALNEDDSWGDNALDDTLAAGEELQFDGVLTYAPETLFDLDFVTADGEEHTFSAFDFSGLSDPENITVTFTIEDGSYTVYLN